MEYIEEVQELQSLQWMEGNNVKLTMPVKRMSRKCRRDVQ